LLFTKFFIIGKTFFWLVLGSFLCGLCAIEPKPKEINGRYYTVID